MSPDSGRGMGKEGAVRLQPNAGGLLGFVCSLPQAMVFSESSSFGVAGAFRAAGFERVDPGRYLSGSFLLSALAAAASLAALLFFLEASEAVAACLAAFSAAMGGFLALPRLLARRQRMLFEQELPFLLRELAACLDVGLPFEKAIARVGNGDYALSKMFAECSFQVSSGASVQQALSRLSARSGSLPIKRAMLLLSSIYETGGGTEPLKRMSEELSESLLLSMRTKSGRFSLLAIAFIASSALLPSFFIVYSSVVPALAGERVDAVFFHAAFLILFPAIDLAVLAAMLLSLPPSKMARIDEWRLASEHAKRRHAIHDLKSFLAALSAISALAAAISLYFGFLPLAALLLCLAPAAYAALSYFASREISEAETQLPDALYSAAATHRLFSSERMLSFLANGGFGRLSEAFGMALARQKAGEGFEQSLSAAEAHCPSPLVHRAFSLLVVAHQTGADMYFAMRESAADVVSSFSLVRERAALLSMQRYTVLASCALLVPAIIGAVAYISPSLSANALLGAESNASSGTIGAGGLLAACQIYLLINAVLSSLLLAVIEGTPGKAAIYFFACAPLSQAAFAAVSSGAFLPGLA